MDRKTVRTLPEVGKDEKHLLDQVKVFALDMDGTVYFDETFIDGAKEWLQRIEESGRTYFFLTNNSSKDADTYVRKLKRMGLTLPRERFITSGDVTIWYLKKNFPGKKVYLLGNGLLRKQFLAEGIQLVGLDEKDDDLKEAEVLVTGFDTELTYLKLCHACDLARKGLPYVATHPDFNCPTKTGYIPDIGSISAFIKASTGREPDHVCGKPGRDITDYLMMRLRENAEYRNITRSEIAMVGDRLYTDVKAGIEGGLVSIFVLSGEGTLQDAAGSLDKPDLIYESVRDIPLY